MTETPDTIWSDDLLNRRSEAKTLIGYIESVFSRGPLGSEPARAFTIAVDAGYGRGKSFFLRRLAQELSLAHPVAFVDAWSDDLADEPMVALAATLKEALKPLLREPAVRSRWATFVEKSGAVAKIAGIGLLKRGAGLLISNSAAEAASEVIAGLSDKLQDDVDEALKDTADEVVEETTKPVTLANSLMQERIREFEAGRAAIEEMKSSLRALIGSLVGTALVAPIVIVVDELDRCRPTYSIKLLEEIKHLFDVPGLIFVFGLHGDQLAHSVAGAYGPGFDGKAYLRRFLSRRYSLAEPDLEPLTAFLLKSSGLEGEQFLYPHADLGEGLTRKHELATMLATYIRAFDLTPRDAASVVDMLQTCVALAAPHKVHFAYLLPLIFGHIRGLPAAEVPAPSVGVKLRFESRAGREAETFTIKSLADRYEVVARYDRARLAGIDESGGWVERLVAHAEFENEAAQNDLGLVRNYERLVGTVARFSLPDRGEPG